jgi:hypothetical protein
VAGIAGWWLRDVVITRDEIEGPMADLLCVDAPPAGTLGLLNGDVGARSPPAGKE